MRWVYNLDELREKLVHLNNLKKYQSQKSGKIGENLVANLELWQ
jgi:hypothetical protein